MSLAADLKVLYHLALAPVSGKTHAERLESFYRGQAETYDAFRARLLPGRRELFAALPTPAQGIWVDLGGGTGANLEFLGARLGELGQVYLVDLSPALLDVARHRIATRGWTNVDAIEADATTFLPPGGEADVVTLSYALTMIPGWFRVVEQAYRMLKPGGLIGVVDFYVAEKHPTVGAVRHRWSTRTFWPIWFAADNVFLSPDHLPYLHYRFEAIHVREHRTRLPYLPSVRAPYYEFIGRKSPESRGGDGGP